MSAVERANGNCNDGNNTLTVSSQIKKQKQTKNHKYLINTVLICSPPRAGTYNKDATYTTDTTHRNTCLKELPWAQKTVMCF